MFASLLAAVVMSAVVPMDQSEKPESQTLPVIVSVDDYDRSVAEVELFKAVNAERARYNLPPLEWDGTLVVMARRHSLLQCRSASMFHSGYGPENVAMGQADVASVMNTWMNSSGHRANILSSGVTRFGGSGWRSAGGACYWTQVFSR